jgi:crotonobetainyl-CoA:carnitine CoA-transferase CaiB-like acyl-CoA transferase
VNKTDFVADAVHSIATDRSRRGPLVGLRVLDLTHMLAGPYCTWLLGALGAEITKVEMPDAGDFSRGIAPFAHGMSVYFASVNRNKRSITLNLKRPSGRAALLRLASRADILVENNRPGVMDRLQLGYAEIAAINPFIIYASISGFGQSGPYRQRAAFDAVVQAMSGMMSITGEENGPPARVGASIGDIGGSLFAAVGILAALTDRSSTGRGSHVDVAMFDSQIAILENAVARFLNAGDQPKRLGSRHPLIAPFQAFPTKDAPIVVCVDTELQWQRFCETIGRSDLVQRISFRDSNERARHHAELEPELVAALAKRSRDDWLSAFAAADVPAGPVNEIAAVVDDPQLRARDMIGDVEGSGVFVRQPVRFSRYSNMLERPAPSLGEHTEAILREYGYSADEILAMRADGAI